MADEELSRGFLPVRVNYKLGPDRRSLFEHDEELDRKADKDPID